MSLVYLELCMAWAHLEEKFGTGTTSNIYVQKAANRSIPSWMGSLKISSTFTQGQSCQHQFEWAGSVSWAGFSPVCVPQSKCWSGKWILRNFSLARVWLTETYKSLILQISAFLQLLLLKKTGSLEIFTADTLQCDLAQLGSEALHVFIVFK